MNKKLVFSFTIISLAFNVGQTTAKSDYRQVGGRYRRGDTESQCQDLFSSKLHCIKNVTWDLMTMFMNANGCNSISNKTLRGDCIDRSVCQPKCVIEGIDGITCENSQDEWRKFVLLKLLCHQKVAEDPCINILSAAYLFAATDNEKLHYLNTTSGRCCIASLMKFYNSSGNVTELLPMSWERAGLPVPKDCYLKALESSTAVPGSPKMAAKVTTQPTSSKDKKTTNSIRLPSTAVQSSKVTTQPKSPKDKKTTSSFKLSSTTLPTNKSPTQPKESGGKKSSSAVSSRLKASLVIASIIFVVVAVIIGRYCYHQKQLKRRAKYEDYGYSQLKVILEDNLYEDEEDDDPLLSAT